MYEHYRAVLGAVREGLLLVDDEERVQLVNEWATRLLALPADVEGRRLDDLDLPPGLVAAVRAGPHWPTRPTCWASRCWS